MADDLARFASRSAADDVAQFPSRGSGDDVARFKTSDTPSRFESRPLQLKSGRTIMLMAPEQAALEAPECSFAEWNTPGKLLYFGHLCWLLQEFFWILLLSYPAFLFGLLSSGLVAIVVYLRRDGGITGRVYGEPKAEVLVNVIHAGWLLSSLLHCIGDLAIAPRSELETPGYAWSWVTMCTRFGKALDKCDDANDALETVVLVGYCITVGVWLACCCYLLYLWVSPPRFVAQGHAFQTCLLEGGWISFWVLSDLASLFDEGFPYAVALWGIHFVLLVTAMVVSSSRSQIALWNGLSESEMEALSNVVCRLDVVIVSYILWSVASLFWMIAEDKHGRDGWRYAAAGIISVSIMLFLAGYKQAMQRGRLLLALKDYSVAKGKIAPEEMGNASG